MRTGVVVLPSYVCPDSKLSQKIQSASGCEHSSTTLLELSPVLTVPPVLPVPPLLTLPPPPARPPASVLFVPPVPPRPEEPADPESSATCFGGAEGLSEPQAASA
jgi:hypothetical protein